ncbi:hypothetical protein LOAG_02186 [Loa loa]|uniref:Uncharacterized protein n=1 Tax=Loa loa TaxID=7209 RepID=A0A1S0U983_LOALO|nr:hypothetical protein LOAG_02186 [Loa loa]EFO26299.1 hypothetical protein LOAG_02186 [Loa loa]
MNLRRPEFPKIEMLCKCCIIIFIISSKEFEKKAAGVSKQTLPRIFYLDLRHSLGQLTANYWYGFNYIWNKCQPLMPAKYGQSDNIIMHFVLHCNQSEYEQMDISKLYGYMIHSNLCLLQLTHDAFE